MKPIVWDKGCLRLLDQTKLPLEEKIIECRDYRSVADAIREMRVRGAPAIGAAAAYGMVIGARGIDAGDKKRWFKELEKVAETLKNTRPTAVNLTWAVDRMLKKAEENKHLGIRELQDILENEAVKIAREDVESNYAIGRFGNTLVPERARILTHCNAGALATVGYGTALGIVRAAHASGKDIHVFAGETRPFLQGARLTVWELMKEGIEVTLITDNMAGYVMAKGMIDLVIVGADRIASNGDVANKIGTYSLAVLAKENNIPFYVAAPLSTIDMSLSSGEEIPIEERAPDEVLYIQGRAIAPEGVKVFNPAFDITPNSLITAIITDKGVIKEPYDKNLKALFSDGTRGNN